MRFQSFIRSISLFFLPLGLAYAQNDPYSAGSVATGEEKQLFQEIPSVFTASKYEQKVSEALASVCIVTADEIK